MATELAKAYVQIIPSAKGISGAISKELDPEATSAGKSAGINIAGAITGVIAAAGIGETIKKALDAGGALQQSFGGLDTIYGDASQEAKKFATEAAKAGISANTYAEQAVSFGAALKQAYGGDLSAAVGAANTAILDMADNSAKMGTDITSIQTAYQGFAKQNYTMLDNLKLGYGGTKEEMQRLLADAERLSGVEYDISNLGDVYNAIHVIQEDLGLTGVAAKEASETFSGSLAAMKAAGENLLANLALGEDITPALESLRGTVSAFLTANLFPMIANIIKGLPDFLKGTITAAVEGMNFAANNADEIIAQGMEFLQTLAGALVEGAPELAKAAVRLAGALVVSLAAHTPDMAAAAWELLNAFGMAILAAQGEVLNWGAEIVNAAGEGVKKAVVGATEWGRDMISNFIQGIKDKVKAVKDAAVNIAETVKSYLGFSEPELGPLSNFHTFGPDMAKLYAEGIAAGTPMVREAADEMAAAIREAAGGEDQREIIERVRSGGQTEIRDISTGSEEAVISAIYAAARLIVEAIQSGGGEVDMGAVARLLWDPMQRESAIQGKTIIGR